jgi:hypothetical protein
MGVFCGKKRGSNMIPVTKQKEPENFNEKVRIPGANFLRGNPSPNSRQLQYHNYWRHIKSDLYQLYRNVCAYTGEWIPETSVSVDHFIPKTKAPQLAYEWDNYRLTTGQINHNKADKIGLIDPFEVQAGWFVLDIPGCYIKPSKTLNKIDANKVNYTIDALSLNSDELTEKRHNTIQDYVNKGISFDFLKKRYLYIAYELERQGLRDSVSDYFKTLK